MSQSIKIAVSGAATTPYRNLVNFQGDLKILTEESYQRFKQNILRNGFIDPIGVWIDPEGTYRILNGHQRLAAIKRMVEKEGFQVSELPINLIEAESLDDAKRKLLALTSEYGKMTADGLVNFLADMSMTTEELRIYLEDVAQLKDFKVEDVLSSLGEIKVDVAQPDDLDVGNMVIGSDQAPITSSAAQAPAKKNDQMSGLRLVQIFLTDDQLSDFKTKTDAIQDERGLETLTDVLLHAVDCTFNGLTGAKNANDSGKKSKKPKS